MTEDEFRYKCGSDKVSGLSMENADPQRDQLRAALEVALEALKGAIEELYECHSHCDPETSDNSDAVAYRECKQALKRINELKG